MGNIETVITLLKDNKESIIAVVEIKTEALSDKIDDLKDSQKEDRGFILELQKKVYTIERSLLIRDNTCFKDVQEIKKYTDLFHILGTMYKRRVLILSLFISVIGVVTLLLNLL